MDFKVLEYVWQIISMCVFLHDVEKAKELASSIYDRHLDFPPVIEELIIEFSVTGNLSVIDKLALYLVKNRVLATDQHVLLIALLFKKGMCKIKEAAELLSNLQTLQINSKNY